jgi:hypothetical protein
MALRKRIELRRGTPLPLEAKDLPANAEAGYYTLKENATIDNVYHKIISLEVIDSGCIFTLASQEADRRSSIDYSFSINKAGGNFIEQAYEYLKTLPEFADAVDC